MTLLDFDPSAAAQAVRYRDAEEMARRYRRVFGGQDGRTVLLDLLHLAGVAQIRPPGMSDGDRRHHDGRAALALEILALAGPDVVGATVGVMTADLVPPEGLDDDRPIEPAREPAGRPGANPDF
ncbi:Bbp19 family protein [Caulobacter hibisci]|uniref:Bbp19-like phage domain-containing protein n=1 Tax=Caulobacter hibisci TaxID=2035993 RepID=A0ABS0SYE4_9CAUL|nr:hypothetical protein [Caulobacter hibisci]MBI1684456.1 hypothetical protein [Caulobacter hibisci]